VWRSPCDLVYLYHAGHNQLRQRGTVYRGGQQHGGDGNERGGDADRECGSGAGYWSEFYLLNFGNARGRTNLSQVLTITNTGTATLSISQLAESGSALPWWVFAALERECGAANYNHCSFPANLSWQRVRQHLNCEQRAGSPLAISLSGTGVASTFLLGANPTSLSFGSVNVGSNSSLGATLTNNGNSNVTISSVAVTGTGFSGVVSPAGTVVTPQPMGTLNVTVCSDGHR